MSNSHSLDLSAKSFVTGTSFFQYWKAATVVLDSAPRGQPSMNSPPIRQTQLLGISTRSHEMFFPETLKWLWTCKSPLSSVLPLLPFSKHEMFIPKALEWLWNCKSPSSSVLPSSVLCTIGQRRASAVPASLIRPSEWRARDLEKRPLFDWVCACPLSDRVGQMPAKFGIKCPLRN